MEDQLADTKKFFQSLDVVTSQLINIISSLSEEQLNTVPWKDGWTAAQVAEHVTKSNNAVAQGLEMEGKPLMRNLLEREPELKDVFLDFKSKYKSPDFILPTKRIYKKEPLLSDLKKSIERIEKVRTKVNLSETMILPGLGEITKLEILYFVLYHTQRHMHQVGKILKTIK